MSVLFYEPFYDIERLIDNVTGALESRPALPSSTNNNAIQRRSDNNSGDVGEVRPLRPRMDLSEDTAKNLVTATFELPGLKKDDVNIEVNNNRLTVSGATNMSSESKQGDYAVRERRYGKFSRTLQLPDGVKDKDIKASLDNGVLTVNFPKAPEDQAKKIAIN